MKKKIMKTMDGNTAAAYVAYAFTDVAAIYPITPSSNMAEAVDEWSAYGKKNIFGQQVLVSEMQSEGGASGAVHGSLQGGALTTTFTASQGLLLMIPNMYKMSGELLPAVFHVSARAVATHALSIFGDHSDVMATRQTGFAMIAAGSVQEVMDLAGVAHLSAIKSRVPFLHFFDGFRTSHEIQKIELIDYEDFSNMLDWQSVDAFRQRSLNPERPVTRGTAQNPDIFFQARESANVYYDRLPEIVSDYMKQISELTGREYKPFDYYGAEDAKYVIVAMGSVIETISETVDYLLERGEKVGVIKVRLYRPFVPKLMFDVLPKTVEAIGVLDRTKEPGSNGEPLYHDVRSAFYNTENAPIVIGGRYGLGSKDTTPSQIKRLFDELKKSNPKNNFTIGINDDVTNLSLNFEKTIISEPKGTVRCKFWGLGSDGTVGANKNAIKIIGDNTDLYAQGYFAYDSKKSGGVTISHLRFGKKPIRSTYLIEEADYIACHNASYVNQYDLLTGLKHGGTFVLNCKWNDDELDEYLPAQMKAYIANNDIKFYTIDATSIAEKIGLGSRINMIMQSAFFKLADVIPVDQALEYLKEAIQKTYGKKGEKIVKMNWEAVDEGANITAVHIPDDWNNALDSQQNSKINNDDKPNYIKNILMPMNAQKGDLLPVSTFIEHPDGTFENGSAAYEKRGIAVNVPEWQAENCIQCNQCSFVCPHSVIRPFLLNEEEKNNAPEHFHTVKAIGRGMEDYDYKIQVSVLDCTGCGNCADVCPAKKKALLMKPLDSQTVNEVKNWEYANNLPIRDNLMPTSSFKGSQFAKPLFEFSGACAGCGETPYIKLVTQLYGDRMLVANATGCSSIWGGSAPTTPYCKNSEGKGPAWANSLFEDNAEYGYGMAIGIKAIRARMKEQAKRLVDMNVPKDVKSAFVAWLDAGEDVKLSKSATLDILKILEEVQLDGEAAKLMGYFKVHKDYLIPKSVWIVGGDGWAYDIGYGGLDHVIASGENVNILVFDTEVYSNTGGQASKATPAGAVAKFAASGMKIKKKDLGLIATTYGYAYVAQVSMGANKTQLMKVLQEAESFNGPSLIICYSPCISHGIKTGMGTTQNRMKLAVDSGYWHLWKFDPRRKEAGKNPFVLESKAPTMPFRDFLMGETRYTTLLQEFPEEAKRLFAEAEEDAKERYESYLKMAQDLQVVKLEH